MIPLFYFLLIYNMDYNDIMSIPRYSDPQQDFLQAERDVAMQGFEDMIERLKWQNYD